MRHTLATAASLALVTCTTVAACDSAELGACGVGTQLEVDGQRFCVYGPDRGDPSRYDCPGSLPFRIVVIGGGIVCSSRALEPEELPPAICAGAGADECLGPDAGSELDAGPEADADLHDGAVEAGDSGTIPVELDVRWVAVTVLDESAQGRVFLVDPAGEREPIYVTDLLDDLMSTPSLTDFDASLSPGAEHLAWVTDRWERGHEIAVAEVDDLATLAPAGVDGGALRGLDPALSGAADVLVYSTVGPTRHVWATRRVGGMWQPPFPVTQDPPMGPSRTGFSQNVRPSLNAAGDRIVFACGDDEMTMNVCEMALDGTDLHVVAYADRAPGATGDGLDHPRYSAVADEGIVFRARWIGREHIYAVSSWPDGAPRESFRLRSGLEARYPCSLADGSLVSIVSDADIHYLGVAREGVLVGMLPLEPVIESGVPYTQGCGGR